MKNTSAKSESRKFKAILMLIVTGIIISASFLYWLYEILKVISA